MAFNHLKPQTSSMKGAVTGNFQRLQSRPSAGLRLQG
ncbi:hypothetical protein Goari_001458 [Gossypium aridum]|uniref:Uncharacterized protein n=1 Tax=Gossypium aridum TaxID=34290 RepID=A0A7J8YJU2_GOSAI|nr:hypothetical protein [Gossypium aridum]